MAGKRTFGGWLARMLFRLILLCAALFAVALGILVLAEKNPPARMEDSDAIIVLGAQVKENGELSVQLTLRLEAALAEFDRSPRPMVVCGARGKNEPVTEGAAMKKWLVEQGVPENMVIAEETSTDTRGNLMNALALLPPGEKRITVVTSDYHLPRALQLARDMGLQCDGVGSPIKPEYWVKNHFREVLAWGKYAAVRLGILK